MFVHDDTEGKSAAAWQRGGGENSLFLIIKFFLQEKVEMHARVFCLLKNGN